MPPVKRIVIILLAIFFITSLSKNLLEYRKNISFYEDYRSEYLKEKKRNEESYVKTQDTYEFEKTVRNKLNLHKENEVVLIIPEPTPTTFVPSATPMPNYKQWADVLF